MQYQLTLRSLIVSILLPVLVDAQSVLYSSSITDDDHTKFDVIGKAGSYYWLYKIEKEGFPGKHPKEVCSFEVYDARLNFVRNISSTLPDSVVKQYLVPQRASFDQLQFKKSHNKTNVVVNRFSQDGDGNTRTAHLFDFPQELELEDVLVTRSPDRTKILLLGFVRSANVTPDLYARVYTENWELVKETIYKSGYLLQPFIQYERTENVLESTDDSPVKLTNSGDWLMVTPTRLSNSLVLCHFTLKDSSFVQVDIKQPRVPGLEPCTLSVEEGKDAFVGILQNVSPADKKVRIVQYSLQKASLGYDTSYSFHLPNEYKKLEEYLYEEEFVQIPGKGFMFLKEYGRRFFVNYSGEQTMLDDEQEYAAYSTHAKKLKLNRNEYVRNSDVTETKKRFERGDLSVKYFPFHPSDSSWGATIQVEQATELRYDDLSYACVPSGDKIVLLYNSLAKNEHKVGSTITLDETGTPVDEGIIFWRSENVLDFQKAKPVYPGELFVPFDRNANRGFAIIHFQ